MILFFFGVHTQQSAGRSKGRHFSECFNVAPHAAHRLVHQWFNCHGHSVAVARCNSVAVARQFRRRHRRISVAITRSNSVAVARQFRRRHRRISVAITRSICAPVSIAITATIPSALSAIPSALSAIPAGPALAAVGAACPSVSVVRRMP